MPRKFEPIDLTERGYEPIPSGPSEGLHLFISDPRVVDLPDGGCITFKFKRGPVTLTESTKSSPGTASCDLTLLEICEVEHVEEYNDQDADNDSRPDNVIDELFREAREGSESGSESGSDSDEDEKE